MIEQGSRIWHIHFKCGGTVKSITKEYATVYLDTGILIATRRNNLEKLQPCGHPLSAVGGNGMTHYCTMCEK